MTVTEFRAAFDTLTPHGWLTLDEALLLVDYAERVMVVGERMTLGAMLEVGSYYGRSAMLLGHVAPLLCVDPWADCGEFRYGPGVTGDDVFAAFRENVAPLGVHYCRSRIEDWVPPVNTGPFRFAYLDGDHTYQGTLNQIDKVLPLGPRVVAVHDVNDSGGGVEVKRACLERLGPWAERVGRLAVWGLK